MRIALVGYGRMGRAVEEAARARGDEIVARLDREDRIDAETLAGAEVAIEFSVPSSAPLNLRRLAEAGVDTVSGTTGWDPAQGEVDAAVRAAGTGLLVAANFSLGVGFFHRIVREAARLAAGVPDYDVHLHEAHHRHKLDHPSGTARMLADSVVQLFAGKERWEESPPAGRPQREVVYLSVARAGEIAGTHVVSFEGPNDRVELRHEARDRGGFAVGAVEAAHWVRGRPGVHTLGDWLRDRFTESPSSP